jgi:hypothetical protein
MKSVFQRYRLRVRPGFGRLQAVCEAELDPLQTQSTEMRDTPYEIERDEVTLDVPNAAKLTLGHLA